jgi:hypothetical protein
MDWWATYPGDYGVRADLEDFTRTSSTGKPCTTSEYKGHVGSVVGFVFGKGRRPKHTRLTAVDEELYVVRLGGNAGERKVAMPSLDHGDLRILLRWRKCRHHR